MSEVWTGQGGLVSDPLEDYALLGDLHTAALVACDGSIDWLCLPRFDSAACFAALLGDEQNGRWQIVPTAPVQRVQRRYQGDSLILDTEMTTASGTVRLTDGMPPRDQHADLIRVVEGVDGEVELTMRWVLRFGYGSVVPWVRRVGTRGGPDEAIVAVAGPDAVVLRGDVLPRPGGNRMHEATFTVRAGDRLVWTMLWFPSYKQVPVREEPRKALQDTVTWWHEWADVCSYQGPHREALVRSLVTLKALTFDPTGGIIAAPTTSLPEQLGGSRNWDYRYCWLRDATLTLWALGNAGFVEEAAAWRAWLLRAVAGAPEKLQIMYGAAGERDLAERELPWLAGYEDSRPVRVGNAAAAQFQLDVYGEVLNALHQARRAGVAENEFSWAVQRALLEFLETAWRRPDKGLWEVRGPDRHFTHSKLMCWVAFDRAVLAVETFGLDGPVDTWRSLREEVHADICARAWNPDKQAFTQYYGGSTLDAAVLMMPMFGFLAPQEPRMLATVAAIERELRHGDLVDRYTTEQGDAANAVDGLPGREASFLACSFWLVEAYALAGREGEAQAMFTRLLGLANDVGLLAEEYDGEHQRMVGNFPQAFSHVALVNAALTLAGHSGSNEAERA